MPEDIKDILDKDILEVFDEICGELEDDVVNDITLSVFDTLIKNAREDFNLFVELCLKDKDGKPLKLAKFQKDINKAIQDYDWVYIEVPRGHGKTTLVAVAYTLWEIGRNPNIRIKIICNSSETARERVSAIEEHIETNRMYKLIFPEIVPLTGSWSKHKFRVRRTFKGTDDTCSGYGIFTTGVGGRSDLLIFDDIVDERNTLINPADIDKVKSAFHNTWMKTQEKPRAKVVMIGTPWHEDDLTQDIKLSPTFHSLCFAINDDLEPLWPEQMPKEYLQREYDLDPVSFDRAYKCRPVSARECYFPAHWIDQCYDASPLLRLDNIPPHWPILIGVDLALGSGRQHAYTVFFVLAIDENHNRVPIKIIRNRLDFPKIIDTILRLNDQHHPRSIVIEDNAFQKAAVQQIIYECDKRKIPTPNIVSFTTNAYNKEEGLRTLAREFYSKQWRIPYDKESHDVRECECGHCVWIREMKSYPFGKFKDTVMACWFASMPITEGEIMGNELSYFKIQIDDNRDSLDGFYSDVIDGKSWYDSLTEDRQKFDMG